MTRAETQQQLATAITALIEPRTTSTRVRIGWDHNRHAIWKDHDVRLPPLLTALEQAMRPGSAQQDNGKSVPGSRPPLVTDALSLHHEIVRATHWFATIHSIDGDEHIATAAARLRHLAGIACVMPEDDLGALTKACTRWVAMAEMITGETTPPFRPDAPCPACDRRHGLRIYVADKQGYCTHCRVVWGPDEIGILGGHVSNWTNQRIGAA